MTAKNIQDLATKLCKPFNIEVRLAADDAGAEIPGGVPTPTWWGGAVDYLGNNIQLMLDGKLTPDEVIQQSTEAIQTNLIDRQ